MSKVYDDILLTITKTAKTRPDAVALRLIGDDVHREMTFATLREAIQTRAECLKNAGIRPGDRVVLCGVNSPEWMCAYFSVVRIDAIVVLLDSQLTNEQFQQILQRVEPIALILDEAHHAQSSAVAPDIIRIQMETGTVMPGEYPDTVRTDVVRPDALDPATGAIVFTSGSTAQPKGVVLSRSNIAHGEICVVDRFGLSESSELLCILPFHHVLGVGACLATLRAGGATTLLQKPGGELLLKAMQATHTTVLPGPPRLFELLLTNIHTQIQQMPPPVRTSIGILRWLTRQIRTHSGFNPGQVLFRKLHDHFGGHLHILMAGGAALPSEVHTGFEELGFNIMTGYGMTETAGAISINTPERNRAGTVGHPFPEVEVRIANQDVSGEGEIWTRSPSNMMGYFHDDAATAETFREDGWLRTGDIGHIDRDGFISITGRIKELIVTSAGKNVAPEAVEHHYRGIDEIKELAVLGMPSSVRTGEEVHAAIIPQGSGPEVEQRIRDAVAARSTQVPSYSRIQRVHIVREIPRTTTLKVRRSVLRQMLLEESTTKAPHVDKDEQGDSDELTRNVIEIVRGIVGSQDTPLNIGPESVLVFDLGLDSLGVVELTSCLQQEFNVTVEITQIHACKTVADLAQLVRRNPQRDNPQGVPASSDTQADEYRSLIPPLRTGRSLILLRILHTLFRWMWNLRVVGRENVPEEGPYILCPNHESHMDVVFVTSTLPPAHQTTLCTFAKREHFDAPVMRTIANMVHAIPVDRKGDPRKALDVGAVLLKAGRPILIHPEGTRTRDGALKPFRRGAAHLALHTGFPLIPVRIDGAFNIFPPHARLPKLFSFTAGQPLRLRVAFGTPIMPPKAVYDADTERLLTEQLRQAVEALEETT